MRARQPLAPAAWRGFLRGSLGTGVAVAARGGGALVLNKLVATLGGPGALTQLAQLQNLMGLLTVLTTDGVQAGATAYLAPLRPGRPRYRLWLGTALWLTVAAVSGGGLVLLALGGPQWPAGRVLGFTLALLLVAGQALAGAVLLAAGRRRSYVALALALSALGPGAVALLLAGGRPLPQVLLGYVAGQALTAPLAAWLLHRAGLLRGLRWGWPRPAAVRGLLRFVLMALGTLLFGRAVDYALRAHLMEVFSPTETDRWQAVAKLSDNLGLMGAAVLSTVYYPRLAALAAAPAAQRRYVRAIAGLLAAGLGLGLGLLYLGRGPVLALLFAPRLASAAALMGPQLLGDWAKLVSWVFQYQLLVRRRPGPYLLVQALLAVQYTALLLGGLPRWGLPGVVWAYAGHYSLVLLGSVLVFWWKSKFNPAA